MRNCLKKYKMFIFLKKKKVYSYFIFASLLYEATSDNFNQQAIKSLAVMES